MKEKNLIKKQKSIPEAVLKFDGYTVDSLLYYTKDEYEISKKGRRKLSPAFKFIVIKNPENSYEANVVIKVDFSEEDNPEIPFVVSVGIRGFFILSTDVPIEKCNQLYKVNAIAILFPYLRALVTDITSKNEHSPIILPTINLTQLPDDQVEFK